MSATAATESEVTVDELRTVLKEFILDVSDRLNTRDLEDLLAGRESNIQSSDLGMKPERHLEQELIDPLFRLLGIEYDPQAFGQSGGQTVWPDFRVTNIEPGIVGENKKYNNIDEGVNEIKEYLDRKSVGAEYGVVTDGFQWRMFKIELGGDFTQYPEVIDPIDLRPTLLEIARDVNALTSTGITEVDVEEELAEFLATFDGPNLQQFVSQTAPRLIRDERKRDVEEFYDLYIELLFGEGDDHGYDTSLMDDIEVPPGVEERDSRLFAVTLMNRLLFIKFLESRKVLDDGFLKERVDFYEANADKITGSLYSSQIKPLFYDLFNAEVPDRREKYQTDWFAKVPYLNGGLFRANIPKEKEFDVGDRILPEVISDLIEGSKLSLNGGGLDPAIIGSVFEKTINHIEEERNSGDSSGQKQKGAYYTPSDVTEIVVGRAVDPKLKDTLVEVWATESSETETEEAEIRGYIDEELSLEEILQKIEDNDETALVSDDGRIRIDFGDNDIIDTAMERLGNLRVLDPACGSGHFLTAAMDEIYRAQLSLLRGRRDGGDVDPNDRFAVKRDLALNAIYGLDADRVATEIAKLRVWLKIVEGNSWDPDFGRLPNIDVNIRDGNSLIGLPLQGLGGASLELQDVSEQIDEVLDLRKEYKDDQQDDKTEIERLEDLIRPELNDAYIEQLNYEVESTIESHEEDEDWPWESKVAEWNALVESASAPLYEQVHRISLKREDEAKLSEEAIEKLDQLGFKPYTYSAALDVEKREKALRDGGDRHPKITIKQDLAALLEDSFDFEDHEGYQFVEIRRRPLKADYDNMFGRPNHWAAEFPEARPDDGDPTEVAFDVIVGNPPYGNLLTENEDALTDSYATAGEDVVAIFLERQLSLLDDGGYIGNVASLKIAYMDSMDTLHDIFREKLDTTKISCFAKRPSCVFEGVEVRIAALSGKRVDHGEEETGTIETSEFLRFRNDIDRDDRLRNVSHRPAEGFSLRKGGINGYGDHVALAKIGTERIEGILSKLRDLTSGKSEDDDEGTVRGRNIIKNRVADEETEHVIWRRRGQDYFVSPMRKKLYNADELKPFYFETELEGRAAFLAVSSSLFYLYWCVYADMYHLNMSHVRAFPLPPIEDLRDIESDIIEVSDRLWGEMKSGFDSSTSQFDYAPMKPIIDEADELLGPLYDLSEEDIEFLQGYHNLYGRRGPDDHALDEYDEGDEDDGQTAEG